MYQPNARNKTEVQLTRKLVVKAADIRKMDEEAVLQLVAKLLDVAQDAGGESRRRRRTSIRITTTGTVTSRTTGLVRFVLDDFDKLQEEAYEKAIADARAGPSGWRDSAASSSGRSWRSARSWCPGEAQHQHEHRFSRTKSPRKRLETPQVPGDPGPGRAAGAVRVHSRPDGKGEGREP